MAYGQKYKNYPPATFDQRFGPFGLTPEQLQLQRELEDQQTPTRARASLPGYALGGRPEVDQPSIVGERGPELFVPDQPGTIVPTRTRVAAADGLEELWSKTEKPAPSSQSLEDLWKQTGEAKSTTTGKTGSLSSMLGYEPGVEYDKSSVPVDVRLKASWAGPDYQEQYLKQLYGDSNVRQDKGGRYLVQQNGKWSPVFPHGDFSGAATSLLSPAATTTGGIVGGAIGRAAGAASPIPGGSFLGAAAGGAIGSGLSSLAEEGAKRFSGLSDEIPWGKVGVEAGLGGTFPLGAPAKAGAFNLGSKVLGKMGGVTERGLEVMRGLEGSGVSPPLVSIAPNMTIPEWHRVLRNRIYGDPMTGKRMAVVDQQLGDILTALGHTPAQKEQALAQIADTKTAVSAFEAGQALHGAEVRVAEKAAAARETKLSGLAQEEYQQRRLAEQDVQRQLVELRKLSSSPSETLAADVTGQYQATRKAFTDRMNDLYGAIDRMTGDMSLVKTWGFRQQARNLIDTMEPGAVPPILKRLASDLTNKPMTFKEAHELRTTLREMADYSPSLSPIGQRSGTIRRIAHDVDDALMTASGQTGQAAGIALRAADREFREGIQQFTNNKINNIIQQTAEGRAPNSSEVASILLDTKSLDSVKQMWNVLTPELKSDVRVVDLGNLLEDATRIIPGTTGKPTIDGLQMLGAIHERRAQLEFIHGPEFIRSLEKTASDFGAVQGKIDVNLMDPSNVQAVMQRAIGARMAREAEMAANPAIARQALKLDDPEAVEAAAASTLKSTAKTLAMKEVTTPDEWNKVVSYATKELFHRAATSHGLDRKLSAGAITDALGKYTPEQQNAIWGPVVIEDIKLLADTAKALFPEMSDVGASLAGGQAAAQFKAGLFERGVVPALQKIGYVKTMGWLADRPSLLHAVAGQVRLDPDKGRSLLSYLMQYGTNVGVNKLMDIRLGGGREGGEIPGFNAPIPYVGGAAPTPKEPVEKKYGGPI